MVVTLLESIPPEKSTAPSVMIASLVISVDPTVGHNYCIFKLNMNILTEVKKSSTKYKSYGLFWPNNSDPVSVELHCISKGGKWKNSKGEEVGAGLFHHYKRFQELVWPQKLWKKGPFVNHWAEACLETYINNKYIGAMGCAGSSKSDSFGSNVLTDWYAFPWCTTVLVSSTDLKSLELRIWGMIKRYHRSAKDMRSWLPGHLIEGKQMLVEASNKECSDGRDFKNGIIAVAAKRGSSYVGLGPLIGIHNKRVRLLADECNLMPRAFLDAASNLSKCEDFKLVGLGNPNETTNAHGFLCEPSPEIGGWEGGIDQTPGTKTWKTRFPGGVCLQLPGSDSPNMRAPEGEPPPFPFLITREQMSNDAQIWGIDDWHYTMMNEARMPRGQGTRRVLTRQTCLKFGAFNEVQWRDSRITKIAFLDAAYRGVGGDRCVFGEIQFGVEAEAFKQDSPMSAIVAQDINAVGGRQVINLVDTTTIPISSDKDAEPAEDQIVAFVMAQCDARGIPPENFYFDSGMRTSLVSAFSRGWSTAINSVDCGGKPTESVVSSDIKTMCREYYSKFVTELWFSVRLAVESTQFRGMTEEVCTEFSQREWKLVSGNKIEVESKDEMKAKTGRSPDLADAVAVGLFGARQRGFVIAKILSPESSMKNKNDWRDKFRKIAKDLQKSGQLNFSG